MPGLETNAIQTLLEQLKSREPTQITINAALRRFAPELLAIFDAGWTDEAIVQMFSATTNDADHSEIRRLLALARSRERNGKKKAKRSSQRVKKPIGQMTQANDKLVAAGAKNSNTASVEPESSVKPAQKYINDGI